MSEANVISLEVENVKMVKAATIVPKDRNMVVIAGANGAGKSSALDAMEYALCGANHVCGKPIRDGERSARVTVRTENYVITRRFDEKGSQLIVTNADGSKVSSPQEMLNNLLGKFAFDPLAFSTLSPLERRRAFASLFGISLDAFETERRTLLNEMQAKTREIRTYEVRIDGMPFHRDVPEEERDMTEMLGAVEKRGRLSGGLAEAKASFQAMQSDERRTDGRIEELNRELESQKRMKEVLTSKIAMAARTIRETEEELESLNEAREMFDQLSDLNRKVRENIARRRLMKDVETATADSRRITGRIGELDAQCSAIISGLKLPVDGLEYGSDDLYLNGIPFEQLSMSERIRISASMALANPDIELRIAIIRNGSQLDDPSMEDLRRIAEHYDGQVWVERVGTDGNPTVIFTEGVASTPGRE